MTYLEAEAAVLRSDIGGNKALVMIGVLRTMDWGKWRGWVPLYRLRRWCAGVSDRTIRRHLEALAERGWISLVKELAVRGRDYIFIRLEALAGESRRGEPYDPVDAGELHVDQVDAVELHVDQVDAVELHVDQVDAGELHVDQVDAGSASRERVGAGRLDPEGELFDRPPRRPPPKPRTASQAPSGGAQGPSPGFRTLQSALDILTGRRRE